MSEEGEKAEVDGRARGRAERAARCGRGGAAVSSIDGLSLVAPRVSGGGCRRGGAEVPRDRGGQGGTGAALAVGDRWAADGDGGAVGPWDEDA
jgi:hypothetical protein